MHTHVAGKAATSGFIVFSQVACAHVHGHMNDVDTHIFYCTHTGASPDQQMGTHQLSHCALSQGSTLHLQSLMYTKATINL